VIGPILALALLGSDVAGRPDYVPDTGWNDAEWAPSFYEGWYGDQLLAMGEPPLATDSDLAGFSERLRLLVLPTFQPGYAYRIDVRPDGSAVLRWARLNGLGGYAPGGLARQGSRLLRPKESRRLKAALEGAALSSLPRDLPIRETKPDGTESLRLCIDGTAFVFEHLDAAGRAFVKRDCGPDEAGLRRLAEAIFRLRPREEMN
jgi:hypothetical protein